MSRIKQKDSDIERRLRLALWRRGLRYRKNVKMLGTPDILLRPLKIIIFVDSCFWHGCHHHCRRPKSNRKFWDTKIDRNRARDLKVTRYYRRKGWTVLRFWEHQLKTDHEACVKRIMRTADTAKRRFAPN